MIGNSAQYCSKNSLRIFTRSSTVYAALPRTRYLLLTSTARFYSNVSLRAAIWLLLMSWYTCVCFTVAWWPGRLQYRVQRSNNKALWIACRHFHVLLYAVLWYIQHPQLYLNDAWARAPHECKVWKIRTLQQARTLTFWSCFITLQNFSSYSEDQRSGIREENTNYDSST